MSIGHSRASSLIVVGVAALASMATRDGAAQPTVPDGWACAFCPFESGWSSNWSLGTGYVSDPSGKFGDYTGLNEDGFHLIASGESRSWGESGSYWDLQFANLGLDSRSLQLDGGQPGTYRLRVSLDEIPKYWFDAAGTPFIGIGGDNLTLPAGWVPASRTSDMTTLEQSLRTFDITQKRKTLGLGFDWLRGGELDYHVDYRREERLGSQRTTGSFAVQSAWLPEPIDYVSDEVELSLDGVWERGSLEVAYVASNFSNRATSLTWQNPFVPLVTGADFGRSALAPDNSAYQLRVAGSLRLGTTSRLSAVVANGRLEQDDVFNALTINPNVASSLPRTSLGGRVDTSRVRVDFLTQPTSSLRLAAKVDIDERDNKTPRAVYDYVLTDLAPVGARMNVPYGFERSTTKVSADYLLSRGIRLKGGMDRDVHDRSHQARSRAEEDSIWAQIDYRQIEWLQAQLSVTSRDRTGSDYRQFDLGAGLQAPLMRQYHIADRDQRLAELDLSLIPHERVSLLLRAERSRDSYPDSQLGLTRGGSRVLSFDAAFDLPSAIDAYASWGREDVEFDQAGSQSFADPDWTASTRDTTKTRSLGFSKSLLDERMQLRFDHTESRSRGVTEILAGTPLEAFPDFRTNLRVLSIAVDYDVSESLMLQLGYRNERYTSADWQLDGVGITTLANILTFGLQSPEYDIDMLTVSFTYTPIGD